MPAARIASSALRLTRAEASISIEEEIAVMVESWEQFALVLSGHLGRRTNFFFERSFFYSQHESFLT